MLDVVIAGGGPAGLNAALMLGRAGRTVLLADDGQPRNSTSAAVHGFLSRDGASPAELRRIARGELDRYPSVQVRDTTITTATPAPAHAVTEHRSQAIGCPQPGRVRTARAAWLPGASAGEPGDSLHAAGEQP